MTYGEHETSDAGASTREVDQLCDQFEADWLAGRKPRVEEFLARGTPGTQDVLLRELLLAEWDLRECAGESIAAEDYQQRFPHHRYFVSELWRHRHDRRDDHLVSGQPEELLPDPTYLNAVRISLMRGLGHAVSDRGVGRDTPRLHSEHGRFLPGTKLADRYRIVSLIGQGGMGEVYRADDLKLGYSVALKFLPKEFAERPDWLEYFRSEVRLARQISHPNVCRVYDIGEADGDPFLSMEFIDGEDLSGLLFETCIDNGTLSQFEPGKLEEGSL